MSVATPTPNAERHDLEVLVARELEALGLPAQRFTIQASYLTYAPLDLGILMVWPISIRFQGKPTGVIQIGSPKEAWNPTSRTLITFARLFAPERLKKEVGEWTRLQVAMVRAELEAKGGQWPRNWPRLQVRGAGTVNAMPVKPGTIQQQGKVRKRAR